MLVSNQVQVWPKKISRPLKILGHPFNVDVQVWANWRRLYIRCTLYFTMFCDTDFPVCFSHKSHNLIVLYTVFTGEETGAKWVPVPFPHTAAELGLRQTRFTGLLSRLCRPGLKFQIAPVLAWSPVCLSESYLNSESQFPNLENT